MILIPSSKQMNGQKCPKKLIPMNMTIGLPGVSWVCMQMINMVLSSSGRGREILNLVTWVQIP